MRQVKTSINIGCSPGDIWRVLMDFPAYADWNPYIEQIVGVPAPGHKLRLTFTLPNGKHKIVRPRVSKLDIRRELRWHSSGFLPGMLRSEYVIRIVSRGAMGSTFYQDQMFSGLMLPLMAGGLLANAQGGLEAMNEALKRRCEDGPEMIEAPYPEALAQPA